MASTARQLRGKVVLMRRQPRLVAESPLQCREPIWRLAGIGVPCPPLDGELGARRSGYNDLREADPGRRGIRCRVGDVPGLMSIHFPQ
ncbi:MAG TPA: hypothetical protein VKA15_27415, partial [Isosphaeraceae bacterium]|nr:hypothetical protein [Isosphaeraceae bacterium]